MNVRMYHYSEVLGLGTLFYNRLLGDNLFESPFKLIMFFINMLFHITVYCSDEILVVKSRNASIFGLTVVTMKEISL